MLSKSTITTSLLLASTLVSAAPVATPSDNAAELTSRSPVLGGGTQNGFIMKGFRPRPRGLDKREEHHHHHHHHKRQAAELTARHSVESELVERQPIFGIFRKVLGGRDIEDSLDSREFDELVEREPIFGIFRKVLGGRNLEDSLESRDFDELDERQPIFGIFRKVLGGRDLDEDTLDARELDELEEREPIFGLIRNVFRGKRDLPSYAELEEREPIIPLLLGGAALASVGRKRDFVDGGIIAREWMGSLEELD